MVRNNTFTHENGPPGRPVFSFTAPPDPRARHTAGQLQGLPSELDHTVLADDVHLDFAGIAQLLLDAL